jgi:hypothetical protein
METVKERLGRALKEAKRSIRSLQQALHEAGHPGSSYANVHAYFKGRTKPPVEFIEAAAKELRANPEWLAFGKGWMTEREQREAEATAAILEREDERDGSLFNEWMLEELEGLDRLDASVHLALIALLHRWLTAMERSGRELESRDDAKAYLYLTWDFLWEPLTAWARWIDREVTMDSGSLSDYMTAMLHAMNLSLQVVAPPGLTPEDVAAWPKYPTEETNDAEA